MRAHRRGRRGRSLGPSTLPRCFGELPRDVSLPERRRAASSRETSASRSPGARGRPVVAVRAVSSAARVRPVLGSAASAFAPVPARLFPPCALLGGGGRQAAGERVPGPGTPGRRRKKRPPSPVGVSSPAERPAARERPSEAAPPWEGCVPSSERAARPAELARPGCGTASAPEAGSPGLEALVWRRRLKTNVCLPRRRFLKPRFPGDSVAARGRGTWRGR